MDLEGRKRQDGVWGVNDPVQYGARSWRWLGLFSIISTLMVLFAFVRVALGEKIVGQVLVIDGDTIEIHGKHIHLWGVYYGLPARATAPLGLLASSNRVTRVLVQC